MVGKKTRKKEYYRLKKTKKLSQLGGASLPPNDDDPFINHRLGVFGENVLRIRSEFGDDLPDVGGDQKTIESIKVGVINKSQINFILTHGSPRKGFTREQDKTGTVPENTIICFLGVLGELTANRIQTDVEAHHMIKFFNRMDPGTFQNIFTYRNFFNKGQKMVNTQDMSYEGFRNSTWYYPGDTYHNTYLYIGTNDSYGKGNFSPLNIYYDGSNLKKDICGFEFFGYPNTGDFHTSEQKSLGFETTLKQGIINLGTSLPLQPSGWRLVILSACRDMYELEPSEARKMLQQELYFYHQNRKIDLDLLGKYQRELEHQDSNFFYSITRSPKSKVLVNTKLLNNSFDLENFVSTGNVQSYHGKTPSLVEIKERAIGGTLTDDDMAYLSTFSIRKVFLFFNDLPDDATSRTGGGLFSCFGGRYGGKDEESSALSLFLKYCLDNYEKKTHFQFKLYQTVLFLNAYLDCSSHILADPTALSNAALDTLKFFKKLRNTARGRKGMSLKPYSEMFKILHKIIKKRLPKVKLHDFNLSRITVSDKGVQSLVNPKTKRLRLLDIDRRVRSQIMYIHFESWVSDYGNALSTFPNLQEIRINVSGVGNELHITSIRPIDVYLYGNRRLYSFKLSGAIHSLELERVYLDSTIEFDLSGIKFLQTLKLRDCYLGADLFQGVTFPSLKNLLIRGCNLHIQVLDYILKEFTSLVILDIQEVTLLGVEGGLSPLDFKCFKLKERFILDTDQNAKLQLPMAEIYHLWDQKGGVLTIYVKGIQNSVSQKDSQYQDESLYPIFLQDGTL